MQILGESAAVVAGAFLRTLDVNHGSFAVSTPRETVAITLITPHFFADLRVPCDLPRNSRSGGAWRSAATTSCGSLPESTLLRGLTLSVARCPATLATRSASGKVGCAHRLHVRDRMAVRQFG